MEAMETTFTLKDVIYIVVGVGSALGFYWKMIMNDKQRKQENNQLKIDVEKSEGSMKNQIEKNEATMFKKFTGIHTRMEKNEEKNKGEFDMINKELADVKVGISSINGKLDILINQN